MRHLAVADHQTGEIDGQIAVAADQVGERKDEEYQREQQNRVLRLVVDVEPVDEEERYAAEHVAGDRADADLHQQYAGRVSETHVADLNDLNEQDRQDVGHRVVAAAFEFQQRTHVLFEFQSFRSQYREYRGRIGRRHYGGQQQRFVKRQRKTREKVIRNQVDGSSGDGGGQHDAQRSEDDSLSENRADLFELGVHAPGKQNDAQCDHSDELGDRRAVELDAYAVAAECHPHAEKK